MNVCSHFHGHHKPRVQLPCGYQPRFLTCVLGLLAILFVSPRLVAQLPQLQAPSSWGKVPQGSGACSVEKSCADLAPGMIRDALGPSPLQQNVAKLAGSLSTAGRAPSADGEAMKWIEDALRRSGADEVHVERIGPSSSSEVVIAEMRGRELPQDYVLIPDSIFQSRTGQTPAAENAAVLIDAVRVIHASGNVPRRSIRFLFFPSAGKRSAEEPAIWAFVRKHRANLDHIAVVVSIQAEDGALDGYSLEDRPEMLPAVRDALQPLRSLGIRNFSEGVQIEGDATPFWLEGIPTLATTAWESGDGPGRTSDHSSVDGTALQRLKRVVAVAAVTAYALADAQARIGSRRSPGEVRHSIDSTGVESRLKAAGLWAQWQALSSQENH